MPTALSIVGVAWTLPLILFVLLGGVFSDRYDRRWMMIGADLVRAAAIGVLGLLSIAGVIELWHIVALIAFVGPGRRVLQPGIDRDRARPRARGAAAAGERAARRWCGR